jgi:hypothetical protein
MPVWHGALSSKLRGTETHNVKIAVVGGLDADGVDDARTDHWEGDRRLRITSRKPPFSETVVYENCQDVPETPTKFVTIHPNTIS